MLSFHLTSAPAEAKDGSIFIVDCGLMHIKTALMHIITSEVNILRRL